MPRNHRTRRRRRPATEIEDGRAATITRPIALQYRGRDLTQRLSDSHEDANRAILYGHTCIGGRAATGTDEIDSIECSPAWHGTELRV